MIPFFSLLIDKNQCKTGTIYILCVLISFAVIIDANTLSRFHSTSAVEPQVSTDEKSNEIFDYDVCTTAECIRSAKEILSAMNSTVDPCDDFYQFTCGRWGTEHPIQKGYDDSSLVTIAEQNIYNDVLKLIKSNETVDEPTRKSRDLFRSCMDKESRESLKYDAVFKYLSQLGLPAVPRFFNMSDMDDDITDYKFDWMKTDIAFHALLRAQLLVNCDVDSNMITGSRNINKCLTPEYKFFFHTLQLIPDEETRLFDVDIYSQEQTTIQKAWQKLTNFSITTLIKEKYDLPADFQERFDAAIEIINKTENNISQIKELSNKYDYGLDALESLEELQIISDGNVVEHNRTSKFNWEQYLEESFRYSNLSVNLNDSEMVLIGTKDRYYYKGINEFLSKTSDAELELWAWWRAVLNLIIHTTSDVSEYVDDIFNASDINNELSREMVCSRLTSHRMDFAVTYLLTDQYFQNETKPKVKEIWNNINEAFEMRVNTLGWMDENSKNLTIEKSKSMSDFIGYPKWLENKTILEGFYSPLTVSANTYLDNLIEFNKFRMKNNLEQFNLHNDLEWPLDMNVMDLNAQYRPYNNDMAISFAIIIYLLYNRGLEVLNYGSMGPVLGHELTHGFDGQSIGYDKTGTDISWWSDETYENFSNMAYCYIEQYNQFYVPESDAYINGSETLGENLADNGGLYYAYHAYQNHKNKNEVELKLPGLEQFTNDQLFFIAHGSLLCNERRTDGSNKGLKDVHCLNEFRVLGTVMNSKEFANAFNCPLGSNMNPRKPKCKIW